MVTALIFNKRINYNGQFEGLEVAFPYLTHTDIPSFAAFSLRDENNNEVRRVTTTKHRWTFYRVPPGTYHCNAIYYSNGAWQFISSVKVTITPTEWSQFTPLAQ